MHALGIDNPELHRRPAVPSSSASIRSAPPLSALTSSARCCARIVALSSSTDPVLSAFGRAALDGAVTADSRLFNMAILYCRTD